MSKFTETASNEAKLVANTINNLYKAADRQLAVGNVEDAKKTVASADAMRRELFYEPAGKMLFKVKAFVYTDNTRYTIGITDAELEEADKKSFKLSIAGLEVKSGVNVGSKYDVKTSWIPCPDICLG